MRGSVGRRSSSHFREIPTDVIHESTVAHAEEEEEDERQLKKIAQQY